MSCSFHVAGSMGILVTLMDVFLAERGFSVGRQVICTSPVSSLSTEAHDLRTPMSA